MAVSSRSRQVRRVEDEGFTAGRHGYRGPTPLTATNTPKMSAEYALQQSALVAEHIQAQTSCH